MEQSGNNSHFAERRLMRAANRVRDNWIPIQEEQLRSFLRDAFSEEELPSASCLVSFLKSDLSLYLFSVLRLYECLNDSGSEVPDSLSLEDLVDRVGVVTVLDILNIEAVQCSRFSLSEANQSAADRIEEAAIAAAVTESCATVHALDSSEAYCAAILRQLGMLLITWNYPGLYEEAILNISETVSCEEWLTAELGFTPQDLAREVCGASCKHSIEVFEQYLDDNVFAEKREALFHICRLGEVLGKARYPQYYRFEGECFSEAYTQLDIMGGSHLLEQIQGSFESLMHCYQRNFVGITMESRSDLASIWKPDRSDQEASYCAALLPDSLKTSLKDFYSLLRYEVEAKRLVHLFMSRLVTAAKFDAGALYAYNAERLEFSRRAGTGDLGEAAASRILYEPHDPERDIVQLAFETDTVLLEFTRDGEGKRSTACAVAFGLQEKIGVLYVELEGVPETDAEEEDIVERIGLLKQALEEALMLATF